MKLEFVTFKVISFILSLTLLTTASGHELIALPDAAIRPASWYLASIALRNDFSREGGKAVKVQA